MRGRRCHRTSTSIGSSRTPALQPSWRSSATCDRTTTPKHRAPRAPGRVAPGRGAHLADIPESDLRQGCPHDLHADGRGREGATGRHRHRHGGRDTPGTGEITGRELWEPAMTEHPNSAMYK